MKNIIRISLLFVLTFISIITVNAQNNNINIKAEKVDDGVKIVKTEDGKTSEFVLNMKQAEEYLQQFGGSIDFDIDESGDNSYKISYASENGKTESIEVDLGSLLENLSVDFSEMSDDLKKMVKEIASEIEYEETIDENGNKSIKIKSKNDSK